MTETTTISAGQIVVSVSEREALLRCEAALRDVRILIAAAALTGFNCHSGDWPEKLFHSQQATSAALTLLDEARNGK